MSSAEWNVLGLLLNLSALVLLFRYGLPRRQQQNAASAWVGLILLIAGTACQVWANMRWVG